MSRYVIEFRSGSFYSDEVERTMRGVGYDNAKRFETRSEAQKIADEWSIAGAMVVDALRRKK